MSGLRELIDFAVRLTELAAEQILPHFRTGFAVDNKAGEAGFDPVTLADRNAETAMRREIHRVYPDHGILGEEHGLEPGTSPLTWVIDPIDGTRAFILGQLHWGTLLALNDGTRPIIGVMRQPFTGEIFVGSQYGAELRQHATVRKLASRQTTRLEQVFACATDPTMFQTDAQRQAFDRVARRARAVRYGGDCYTPCLVAAGHADLVIEAGLKPWDIQALVPIVAAAGGVMSDWSGGPAATADNMIVAANRELHAQVVAALDWRG